MNNQKRLKDVCARLDKPPPPLPELCCWCLALSFPPRRGGLALSSGLWRPCGFCSFFVWYSCSCGFVPIRFSLSHLWINWRAYWLFWSLVVWFASRVLPIYFYFIFRLPLFSLCCWLFILWFLFDMWRVHLQEQINIILKRTKPRSVWLMFIWVHSWKKSDLWWEFKTDGPLCEQKTVWGRSGEIRGLNENPQAMLRDSFKQC